MPISSYRANQKFSQANLRTGAYAISHYTEGKTNVKGMTSFGPKSFHASFTEPGMLENYHFHI